MAWGIIDVSFIVLSNALFLKWKRFLSLCNSFLLLSTSVASCVLVLSSDVCCSSPHDWDVFKGWLTSTWWRIRFVVYKMYPIMFAGMFHVLAFSSRWCRLMLSTFMTGCVQVRFCTLLFWFFFKLELRVKDLSHVLHTNVKKWLCKCRFNVCLCLYILSQKSHLYCEVSDFLFTVLIFGFLISLLSLSSLLRFLFVFIIIGLFHFIVCLS